MTLLEKNQESHLFTIYQIIKNQILSVIQLMQIISKLKRQPKNILFHYIIFANTTENLIYCSISLKRSALEIQFINLCIFHKFIRADKRIVLLFPRVLGRAIILFLYLLPIKLFIHHKIAFIHLVQKKKEKKKRIIIYFTMKNNNWYRMPQIDVSVPENWVDFFCLFISND